MRKDICYFYPLPVNAVYDAFVQAAYQQFGKRCKTEPYKTLNFGLNYSFKYNMNGGSLTIHFMPYNNGTAIDMRYTVAQLVGARYQKHADDVLIFVNATLGAQAQPIALDVNQFLAYEAGVPATPMNVAPQEVQPVQQSPAQPQGTRNFCTNCGAPITPQARFCIKCGAKLS